jgi:hypothetical protein
VRERVPEAVQDYCDPLPPAKGRDGKSHTHASARARMRPKAPSAAVGLKRGVKRQAGAALGPEAHFGLAGEAADLAAVDEEALLAALHLQHGL